MLEYHRIIVSEGVDVSKTNVFHGFSLCYYWYILETNFRFQSELCDGCYDSMQKGTRFNDVAIISVQGNDYRIHFCI